VSKGLGWQGFTFGFLFGVFGLIAIAAMEPSEDIIRGRESRLADLIADRTAASTGSNAVRLCPACFSTIARAATVCRQCGRDVPPVDETDSSQLSVTVTVRHCEDVGGGDLLLTVQPGWVLLNACDDACGATVHEVALTVSEAEQFVDALTVSSSKHRDSRVRLSQGEVSLTWVAPLDDQDDVLFIDWAKWTAPPTRDSSALDSPPSHMTIAVSGEIAQPTSSLAALLAAVELGASMADSWENGRLTLREVESAMSSVGELET